MKTLRISDVAARTGVPATTLRYYEDIGLIGPATRSSNGYRNYDERDVERLAVITRAKKLDISLEGVRELMAAWDSDECGTVQDRLAGIVAARLRETREQITELTGLANQLEQASRRLAGTPQEGACNDECACAAIDQPAPDLPVGVSLFPLLPMAEDGPGPACSLERNALPARLDEWAGLTANATGRSDLGDGGIALDFDHDPELAVDLARLAAEEYECCSFFDFTLSVNTAGLRLEVRAPDHARDALRTVFGTAA